ncbi:MAG: FkbM family methyltransferase [Nostoc sp.]
MKLKLLKIFLYIFSRPVFFTFFYTLNKVCLNAMNRTAASQFSPECTGEKAAFKYALLKLINTNKLIIFDCGGNLGYYSKSIIEVCNTAQVNFDLFIFEPSNFCYTCLQKIFGSSKNIKLHKLAVSDLNSSAKLYYPWKGSGGASLCKIVSEVQIQSSLEQISEDINTVKMDDFCAQNAIEKIDFLKLDIEGFELLALQGASQMLTNRKIKFIQIEIGTAALATKFMLFDAWKMLNGLYCFYLILNQGLFEIKDYKSDLECFYGASNFLLELRN